MIARGSFFTSSIGRKFLMALTGVVMLGFVIGHLVGNLQIFEAPDKINGYAAFLHHTGWLLWAVRLVLLVCLVVHVWMATLLVLENRRARGGQGYDRHKHWVRATWSSRYIRWTGYVVLAFILFHLAQFTFGITNPADFKNNHPYVMQHDYAVAGVPVVHAGTTVPNVYLMIFRGFESVPVALFYIIAVGLLSFHLMHGADSMFQTVGWRNRTWSGWLRKVVVVFCLLYFFGNLAIPGSILTGLLRPVAAAHVNSTLISSTHD